MTSGDRIIQLLDNYPANARAFRWYQPKHDGTLRPMTTPNDALKTWLRDMNKALSKHFHAWPNFMHGGIKHRSYISLARPHVGRPLVITIDVKQCFDSITQQEVCAAMARHFGLDPEICTRLANRLCFKGRIAQGFPTSNYVCNLYLLEPLAGLEHTLVSQGINFGNYVDDIVLSGNITNPPMVVNEVARSLSRAKLKMNKAKVHIMPASKQQIVCGLIVNRHLTLSKSLKRKLMSDVAHRRIASTSVDGWVAHLRSIDPAFGAKLRAYAEKKGCTLSLT